LIQTKESPQIGPPVFFRIKKIRIEFSTVPILREELPKFIGSGVEVNVSVGELVGVVKSVAVTDGVELGTGVLVERGNWVDVMVGVGVDSVAVEEAINEGTTDESIEKSVAMSVGSGLLTEELTEQLIKNNKLRQIETQDK
jgi:hypothetical protein